MKNFLFLIYVFLVGISYSQIPTGQWRDHFSYVYIHSAYEMNDGTIVAASESGVFYYNTDGSIEKLTKTNGLSDIGVSTIKYFSEYDAIVVGYENGNIDIIKHNDVYNISDIKRKNIAGNKSIFSITEQGNQAILSCGFGIVTIDIENSEIIDTYYIGVDASFVEVYKTVEYGDSLYAATNEGLFVANKNEYLADFSNWYLSESDVYDYFTDVEVFNNKIYAIGVNGDSYHLVERGISSFTVIENDIRSESKIFVNDKLFLTTGTQISIYNASNILESEIQHYKFEWIAKPIFISVTKDGRYLIGDKKSGMVIINGEIQNNYYPKGVYLNEVAKISALPGFIVATSGGFAATGVNLWNYGMVSVYNSIEWTNIYTEEGVDFYSILQDKAHPQHFYVGSWGSGIIEFENNQVIKKYDESNSTLTSVFNGPYIRISGMAYDSNNNIWTVNKEDQFPINILKPNGEWTSYSKISSITDEVTGDMIITSNNNIWTILPDRGFFVIDFNNTIDNENDDITKVLYPIDDQGDRIGGEVKSVVEDKNGDIWFGTDEGVGVFYSPNNFNENDFRANRIKITAELNDSLVTNYLLKEEQVLSIAVDGGNRKWFGTTNSGVYLMNETGTKELLHFTTENSPLPSNKVVSIAIEPETGEVFFGTSFGVVSYRGDAVEANSKFENVYAFPNPVCPEYAGNITISGLIYQTNVKITDITGNIVFETTSNGGQATWDGNDFSGNRVHTGVYLIFCSNEDGTETFVSKLLFIN